MRNRPTWLSIHKKWMILFALWLTFLSGGFARFLGTPGIIQAYRLNHLFESKKTLLAKVQSELKQIQTEATELENNPFAQLREIRRILGYAAKDEIIFEFNTTSQL